MVSGVQGRSQLTYPKESLSRNIREHERCQETKDALVKLHADHLA